MLLAVKVRKLIIPNDRYESSKRINPQTQTESCDVVRNDMENSSTSCVVLPKAWIACNGLRWCESLVRVDDVSPSITAEPSTIPQT